MRLLSLAAVVGLLGCASLRAGLDPVEQVDAHPEDPKLGPDSAPVKLVLFADFQ